MGELETNEKLNIDNSLDSNLPTEPISTDKENNVTSAEVEANTGLNSGVSETENNSTAITEYKEVEEPCVALTIIGENRLTDTEVFIRRGIKYSIRAFFSAIVLTIMHMFL